MAKPKISGRAMFADAHRDAGELLGERGSRFVLMQAWMISLLFLPLYFTLQSTSSVMVILLESYHGLIFALSAEAVFSVLAAALTLFALLPYLLGVLHLSLCCVRGEDPVLAEVFVPFSSRKAYGRALWISLGIFVRLWLIWVVADSTFYLLPHLLGDVSYLDVVRIPIIAAEVFLGLLLCLGDFLRISVRLLGKGRMPKRSFFYSMRRGSRFFLSYLPHLALGLLTLGVLLLSDVLPRMCLCYFCYCDRMMDQLILSEEENHE